MDSWKPYREIVNDKVYDTDCGGITIGCELTELFPESECKVVPGGRIPENKLMDSISKSALLADDANKFAEWMVRFSCQDLTERLRKTYEDLGKEIQIALKNLENDKIKSECYKQVKLNKARRLVNKHEHGETKRHLLDLLSRPIKGETLDMIIGNIEDTQNLKPKYMLRNELYGYSFKHPYSISPLITLFNSTAY